MVAALDELLAAATGAPDPEGPFCAVVSTEPAAAPGAWSAVAPDGDRCWLLAQVADAGALRVRGRAGVGAVRCGTEGARLTLGDAEQAWSLAGSEPVGFADDWVLATLAGAGARLAPLLAPGREVARRADYLAAAVQAYADAGFSVVGAARALHVHPNTVIYRLDRWRTLTGWDPRSFQGLAMSVASLRV